MLRDAVASTGEIGNLLPNNQRQRRTCYALCHILYPVLAAHMSIFRMDSNYTSYRAGDRWCVGWLGEGGVGEGGVGLFRRQLARGQGLGFGFG